jgi:hypothetical protein
VTKLVCEAVVEAGKGTTGRLWQLAVSHACLGPLAADALPFCNCCCCRQQGADAV